MSELETIVILDFGSQYTQLIARRIREMNVYSEILPPETPFEEIEKHHPRGIILSGGPQSVTAKTLTCDPKLFEKETPLLGICYGMQLLNTHYRGEVEPHEQGEYGKQHVELGQGCPLFEGLPSQQQVWMSHGDSVSRLGPDLIATAQSDDGLIAGIAHKTKQQFGFQFHPEVTHTTQGGEMLERFLALCHCEKKWTMGNMVGTTKKEIRQQVGDGQVVSLVSGGVDSTVATILCQEALGSEQVYPLHIDTGLMRGGESEQVRRLLADHKMDNLIFIDASEQFLNALKGVQDPEEKRHLIGDLFIEILDREIGKVERPGITTYFCQGTLYTDLIESGKGCGSHAAVIKSHHNVNPPIVQQKRKAGLIVEPNAHLFKDEVRKVCEKLGIPRHLAWRHPFPGPGLAIRILGEVTPERVATLQHADAIYLEEIKKAGLYDKIWQAFAILLPIHTVGVMGDQRTYGQVVALRAVTSHDGMTADVFDFPMDLLTKISTRIVNEVDAVNRVVYDTTSKPPGTIEWE